MRIVLDTKILVSSLITTNTPPDMLYQAWECNYFKLITSQAQVEEIERVFDYEHLKSIISPSSTQKLLNTIDVEAVIIDKIPSINISPDPKDNMILATAIAGNANLIVTGDKRHLLSLKVVKGIPIVNAREALDILKYPETPF